VFLGQIQQFLSKNEEYLPTEGRQKKRFFGLKARRE
jgi:hypothetical protein